MMLGRQRKVHGDDFLVNDANIRKAAKYLDPSSGSVFDKISPLVRKDDSTTKGKH